MRIAFVYPGQGSLRDGMAAAWADHPAGDVFDAVGAHAGLDLRVLADDPGSASATAIAQPALFAAGLAAHDALLAAGVVPDVVAGHSLGECTAAVAAGVLDRDAGAQLVAERGRAMAAACRANPGTMAAVVRVDTGELERLVASVPDAQIANDNAPGQVVVSGPAEAVDAVAAKVADARGRTIALDVEGAFHSAAMAPAVVKVDALLKRLELADPRVALVTGTSGEVLRHADAVRRALVEGILAPVRWTAVQRRLADLEVDLLVECGPGGVLKGLAKRAIPDVDVLTVAGPDDVEAVVAYVADRHEPLRIPDDHLTATGATR